MIETLSLNYGQKRRITGGPLCIPLPPRGILVKAPVSPPKQQAVDRLLASFCTPLQPPTLEATWRLCHLPDLLHLLGLTLQCLSVYPTFLISRPLTLQLLHDIWFPASSFPHCQPGSSSPISSSPQPRSF